MPDDRMLHRRAGHSERVSGLSDFDYRVWTTYLLAADDFGIMRATAVTLQAADESLAKRPPGTVQAALERVLLVGLVGVFTHQRQRFVYQADWQDWQKVKYPRETQNPAPPLDLLARCSPETRELFQKHPGGNKPRSGKNSPKISETLGENSGKVPETFPPNARARTPLAVSRKPLAVSHTPSAGGQEAAPPTTGAPPDDPPNDDIPTDEELPDPEPQALSPEPPPRSVPRIASGQHKHHAHCDLVCVPAFLHAEFRQALNRPNDPDGVDAELVAGYTAHCQGWPEGEATGDAVSFWRAWFRARYPAPTTRQIRQVTERQRNAEWLAKEGIR
jgi:hypothetical protein